MTRLPPRAPGQATGTAARQGFGGSDTGRVRNASPLARGARSGTATSATAPSAWLDPVRAATIEPIVLSGAQTIDGVSLVAGDRVLVKDQDAAPEQNGIYVVADPLGWSRAGDRLIPGVATMCREGNANEDRGWVLASDTVDVGTTAQEWTRLDRPQVWIGADAPDPRRTYALWWDTDDDTLWAWTGAAWEPLAEPDPVLQVYVGSAAPSPRGDYLLWWESDADTLWAWEGSEWVAASGGQVEIGATEPTSATVLLWEDTGDDPAVLRYKGTGGSWPEAVAPEVHVGASEPTGAGVLLWVDTSGT